MEAYNYSFSVLLSLSPGWYWWHSEKHVFQKKKYFSTTLYTIQPFLPSEISSTTVEYATCRNLLMTLQWLGVLRVGRSLSTGIW